MRYSVIYEQDVKLKYEAIVEANSIEEAMEKFNDFDIETEEVLDSRDSGLPAKILNIEGCED